MRTVENRWWGVAGGRKVHMVFVYLSRVYNWENALSDEVAKIVAPNRAVKKPQTLPSKGAFKGFPHFGTTQLHISAPLANALADMSAWLIEHNLKIFPKGAKSTMVE